MGKIAGLVWAERVGFSHPVTFPEGSAWAPESSGLRLSVDLAQVFSETASPADREQSPGCGWPWLRPSVQPRQGSCLRVQAGACSFRIINPSLCLAWSCKFKVVPKGSRTAGCGSGCDAPGPAC